MTKKTLNKDIRNSLRQSKGRFLSIMLLMMLGAFSLVGLKVSGPDIEDTLNSYMETANAADLFVVAGYGLSAEDQAEIQQENADVEFGYFVDTVISDTPSAIRVFSQTTVSSGGAATRWLSASVFRTSRSSHVTKVKRKVG